MIHFRFILCQFFVILFFTSCDSFNKNERIRFIDNFPETTTLSGEDLSAIDNVHFFNSCWPTVVDSLLVVVSSSDSGSIYVYSTGDYRLLGLFSRKGRGPGEFMDPIAIRETANLHEGKLLITDFVNFSFTKVDLLESITTGSYLYEDESLSFLPDAMDFMRGFYYGNEQIVYRARECRFSIFNRETNEKVIVPYNYPKHGFPIKEGYVSLMNNSVLAVNPDLKRVVAASQYIGQIDFFSFEGNHISTSVYCDYNKLKNTMLDFYKKNSTTDMRSFAEDIVSDDHFVYVLNCNLAYGELEGTPTSTSEILVFDWDGNPVRKFVLDRIAARIAYDSQKRIFYAVCPFESDYPFVKFDISSIDLDKRESSPTDSIRKSH